jgi:hypothetical protein
MLCFSGKWLSESGISCQFAVQVSTVAPLCDRELMAHIADYRYSDKDAALILITLTGRQRNQLREDLLAHRATSALNDADYVRDILRVSLNTYKKCIGPVEKLSMKRHSFNNIVANTGFDPGRFGAKTVTPAQPMHFGGYTKAEYGYMVGRYFLYRRSFQNDEGITRAVLDISWSDSLSCLTFKELRRFKSDAGVLQANDMSGHIYMHAERVLMGLLAIDNGDARLTLLHVPSRTAHGTNLGLMRTSGALLTHGYPKRFFQPVVSPITLEVVEPSKRTQSPNALCKFITPNMPEYAGVAAALQMAEEHACVMTPLVWRQKAG